MLYPMHDFDIMFTLSQECTIVNKVLHLVQTYNVQTKLHAANLISNGAGRATRIARSVAHAMLTDKSTLLPVRP